MRILLDNCVPLRLRTLLPGHEVKHANEMGWAKVRNGELLTVASQQFDVLITTDQNIRHQQNPSLLPLPVVEIDARDTRFQALKGLGPQLLVAVAQTAKFRFVSVASDGQIEAVVERAPPAR